MLSVHQTKQTQRTLIVGDVRLRIPEKFNSVPERFSITERQPQVEAKKLTISAQSSTSTDTISTSYSTNVADSDSMDPDEEETNANYDSSSDDSDAGGIYHFYELLHLCGCYGRRTERKVTKRAKESPDEIVAVEPAKSDVLIICGNLRTTAL